MPAAMLWSNGCGVKPVLINSEGKAPSIRKERPENPINIMPKIELNLLVVTR
jgi:hypothetical protein